MTTAFTSVTAQTIQALEGCSTATSYRRLQEIKQHFNITVVRIKHLAEYWLASPAEIIGQLVSK